MVERRVSGRKVAGSTEHYTLLCLWKRHFALIFKQVLCVVWKTSTSVYVKTAYTEEKQLKIKNKQTHMVLPVSPKVGLSNSCPLLNVNHVLPRVRKINRYN